MTKALELIDLKKQYATAAEPALKGISLSVEQGDFYALLGPNGAGKSTAIGIISGLVNKTSGQVKIGGYDLDTEPNQVKNCLGVVPQEFNFNFFEKTIDIVANQAGYYGVPRAQAREQAAYYLDKLNLGHVKDKPARFLSGGMKRRMMIARGVVHEPKLLLLDEPTAGVDVELRHQIWTFLREINQKNKMTIILTTHYLEEAELLCRHVGIIHHGQLIKNMPMRELLSSSTEQLIIELAKPMIKPLELSGYELSLNNNGSELTVLFDAKQTLNPLLVELCQAGYPVVSIRAPSNRLERLFLELVQS